MIAADFVDKVWLLHVSEQEGLEAHELPQPAEEPILSAAEAEDVREILRARGPLIPVVRIAARRVRIDPVLDLLEVFPIRDGVFDELRKPRPNLALTPDDASLRPDHAARFVLLEDLPLEGGEDVMLQWRPEIVRDAAVVPRLGAFGEPLFAPAPQRLLPVAPLELAQSLRFLEVHGGLESFSLSHVLLSRSG